MPLDPEFRPDENGNLIPVAEAVARYGITAAYPSESAKYLCLVQKYLERPILDLGSGGWPVVDYAIQVELPSDQFNKYTGGRKPEVPIQIHGDIFNLPFRDNTIGCVWVSHLIEDFPREKWLPLFQEFKRVLKRGGHAIVLVPDHTRWQYAVQVLGQCMNASHYGKEPEVGDITKWAKKAGLEVIEDRLTNLFEHDYSIIGVLRKQ